MATTTYGSVSQRTGSWAAVKMLMHAMPILVLSKFGQNKPVPKNKAQTIKFRRPIPFPVSTTPLVEGVKPTSQALKYADVSVTLGQYGGLTKITDVVHDLAEDPVLSDAAMLSGEQAAETIELVTWGAIKGGTSVIYDKSSHTARTAVNSKITINSIRNAVRALKNARGKPHTSMLSASVKIGTTPIEGGYIAFGHTDLEADIRSIGEMFTPVAQYGSRMPLCPEECGSIENVRIILTPLLTPFSGAGGSKSTNNMLSTATNNRVDVYPFIVCAKEAYGVVPLKGKESIVPMVLNPNVPEKYDPLAQSGFVSWKTYFAAKILNETWLQRIEVGASNL